MKEERWDSYRNYIVEQIRHENSHLFQRFNYFLLMTSFLLIAFISVINSDKLKYWNEIYWVAQTICISGILLSYGFVIINFINTRIIHDMGNILKKVNQEPQNRYWDFGNIVDRQLVREHRFRLSHIVRVYHEFIAFFVCRFEKRVAIDTANKNDLAPHTWLIPMILTLIWITIYSLVFIELGWIVTPSILVFSIIYAFILWTCHYVQDWLMKKMPFGRR